MIITWLIMTPNIRKHGILHENWSNNELNIAKIQNNIIFYLAYHHFVTKNRSISIQFFLSKSRYSIFFFDFIIK